MPLLIDEDEEDAEDEWISDEDEWVDEEDFEDDVS